MKRFSFIPRIGNGSEQDQFRPAIQDHSSVTYKIISVTDENGIELLPFYLTRWAATNSAGAVLAISNGYHFPDAPLDVLLSAIGDPDDSNSLLFELKQSVTARGLLNRWLTTPSKPWNEWLYGELLLDIAKQIDPNYPNFNNFDVPEPQ